MYQEISTIPKLLELSSLIRESIAQPEKQLTIGRLLDQLPYSLAATAKSLVAFYESQSEIVAKYSKRPYDAHVLSMYQLEAVDWHNMAFALDSYLEAAIRTQNALGLYLGQIYRKSFPSSLSKLTKALLGDEQLIPDQYVRENILGYWNLFGEKIKSYRDLSQHHAIVSSDARISFMPGGPVLIFLIIPSNPNVKSPLKLEYEPKVHAVDFLMGSYQRLLVLICSTTDLLLNIKGRPEALIAGQEFVSGLSTRPEGRPLPNFDDFRQICRWQID